MFISFFNHLLQINVSWILDTDLADKLLNWQLVEDSADDVIIFQSHVQNGHYFTSYTIEPMLELLWTEDSTQTRYTVLFPITTPMTAQNPHIIDGKRSWTISWWSC